MVPSTPQTEPASIIAGDTVSWQRSLAEYPAIDWAVSYAFRLERGAGITLNVPTVGVDVLFTATIPAASSSLMKSGRWRWICHATQGTVRQTIAQGSLEVRPNLAAQDFSGDLRSPAKRAYDNALAAWESVKLGQTVMLNGRTYTQHDLDKLRRYLDACAADYQREVQAEQFARTGINPRRIGVRFRRV